jgi:Bacterial dnaA protein helix-turn-helix
MFLNVDDLRQGSNRIALARIDAVVCARLGPARVCGNAQPAAFNRQVAMYLAHRVGWSTTRIGRFYNGRDHSTVCHAIKRLQALRGSKPEVEALVSSLIEELRTDHGPEVNPPSATANVRQSQAQDIIWANEIIDDLAERIASRLRAQVLRQPDITTPPCLGDRDNAKLTTSINLLQHVYLATHPGAHRKPASVPVGDRNAEAEEEDRG